MRIVTLVDCPQEIALMIVGVLTGDSRGIRGDEIDDGWLSQESSLASGRVAPLVTTLEEALAQSRGRISGPTVAAAKLGIPRQTLDRKILSLGIDKNQFKSG